MLPGGGTPLAAAPVPLQAVAERLAPEAATPAPRQDAAEQRYAALPAALREAALRTRAVFDDPAQDFWVLQIGLADSAAGALRLLDQARQAGVEVWVQDRIYPGSKAPAAPVWAVYAGRNPAVRRPCRACKSGRPA